MNARINVGFFERVSILFDRHPEWWVWSLSLSLWVWLYRSAQFIKTPAMAAVCMPMYTPAHTMPGNLWATFSNGMGQWTIMVAAMMFPLLNQPIKHVALSVKRNDRKHAVLAFLLGYALLWSLAGCFFLLLSFMASGMNHLEGYGFLLASLLVWDPARPIKMTKANQTMPIRIYGRDLLQDSFAYGIRFGLSCLNMCWAPMAALMLVHHGLMLMAVVTVVLVYERYFLPHTSKLLGFAWAILALLLVVIKFFN